MQVAGISRNCEMVEGGHGLPSTHCEVFPRKGTPNHVGTNNCLDIYIYIYLEGTVQFIVVMWSMCTIRLASQLVVFHGLAIPHEADRSLSIPGQLPRSILLQGSGGR